MFTEGVKSLGGHCACLFQGFDFCEVKKMLLFFEKKRERLLPDAFVAVGGVAVEAVVGVVVIVVVAAFEVGDCVVVVVEVP